jgi:hypothetical protein
MLAKQKLTLPNGVELTGSQAFETASAYRRDNPAVIDLYDLTNTGPHDELRPIDVLSLNALNSFGQRSPAGPMTNLWVARSSISEVIRPISNADHSELGEPELAAQIPLIDRALLRIDAERNVGDVTASKLLHRMRPGLVPIYDSQTRVFYRRDLPNDVKWPPYLACIFSWLRRTDNAACLKEIQAAFNPRLSTVRIWDIILWQFSWNPVVTP